MLIEFYFDWYMLLFYCVGTAFGLWLGRNNVKEITEEAIENTIDTLIDNNFVKWKRNDDGDVELIKLDDKDYR